MDTSELNRYIEALIGSTSADLKRALRGVTDQFSQAEGRQLVRLALVDVEASLWAWKRIILLLGHATGVQFNRGELAYLHEERYALTESGKVRKTRRHVPLRANIRFTGAMACRVEPDFTPDFGAEGWRFLCRAIDIRNSLTHPRTPEDLELSGDNFTAVVGGVQWYAGMQADFLESSNARRREEAAVWREVQQYINGDETVTDVWDRLPDHLQQRLKGTLKDVISLEGEP